MRLLPARWSWPSGWRVWAGAAAALLAVVVTLTLVVPGSSGGRDELFAEDPTPTATAGSASPTPSTDQSSPAPAAGADKTAGPSTTPGGSASPNRQIVFARSSLLGTSYQEGAFGQGSAAQVADLPEGVAVPGTCFDLDVGGPQDVAPPARQLARTWSWPAEVVVTEVLAEFRSTAEAKDYLASSCRADPDPNYVGTWESNGKPVDRTLPLGEGGFLRRIPREVSTTMYSGTRVGRYLLVLNWRQTGGDTSLAPLEAALDDALAAAEGRQVGEPVAAPPQVVPAALRGYLTRSTLPLAALGDGPLTWLNDYAEPPHQLACGSGASLATTGVPWARNWTRTTSRTADELLGVAVGDAEEAMAASSAFEACQASFDSTTTLNDVGDASFMTEQPAGALGYARSGAIYVRAGASYPLSPDAMAQLLRAAIEARTRR